MSPMNTTFQRSTETIQGLLVLHSELEPDTLDGQTLRRGTAGSARPDKSRGPTVHETPTPRGAPHPALVRALSESALSAPLDTVEQDASVKAGGRDAVERVYLNEGPKIWRALVAYSGDIDLANDAFAEALAQALARGDELRTPERWIWKVSFRIATGELKRRKRQVPFVDSEVVESPELALDLIRALQQITPRQRAVVILQLYGGFTTAEVGRLLGMAQPTVRVHFSQGRKRLRRSLEATDE
jgi:RNA polymerase sigma factor (sigma-70 family)